MLRIFKKTYRIVAIFCYISFGLAAYFYIEKSNMMERGDGIGEYLYNEKGCVACHGVDGKNPVSPFPRVNNQPVDYITEQIKGIKNNQRSGAKTALMRPVIQNLTDKEIGEIAKFLSGIK